jgi:hypothetical protein
MSVTLRFFFLVAPLARVVTQHNNVRASCPWRRKIGLRGNFIAQKLRYGVPIRKGRSRFARYLRPG